MRIGCWRSRTRPCRRLWSRRKPTESLHFERSPTPPTVWCCSRQSSKPLRCRPSTRNRPPSSFRPRTGAWRNPWPRHRSNWPRTKPLYKCRQSTRTRAPRLRSWSRSLRLRFGRRRVRWWRRLRVMRGRMRCWRAGWRSWRGGGCEELNWEGDKEKNVGRTMKRDAEWVNKWLIVSWMYICEWWMLVLSGLWSVDYFFADIFVVVLAVAFVGVVSS